MNPDEVLQTIVRALKDSTEFDGGDYVTRTPHYEGEDNRLEQPFVSLTPIGTIRASEWDSDRVGFTTDANGDRTGRIFRAYWSMDVEAHIIVAAGNANYNASVLGGNFQNALLPYDKQQEDKAFPDGDGGTVDAIDVFRVGDGERDDDLAGPGLRRWRQELAVEFYDERTVSGTTIDTVETPFTKDFTTDDTEDADLVWNY